MRKFTTTYYKLSSNGKFLEGNGFRLAFISDLHNMEFGPDNTVLKAVIDEAAPDLVIIGASNGLDMAEGLKAMALEGHGVAFLPSSAVRKELAAGKLVSAAPAELREPLQMVMDVRAYRERPVGKDVPQGTAQALWAHLQAHGAPCLG